MNLTQMYEPVGALHRMVENRSYSLGIRTPSRYLTTFLYKEINKVCTDLPTENVDN